MRIIRGLEGARDASAPEIVEIAGWKPEQKWQVALKHPSLVNMATDGSVPNPLLNTVSRLLAGGTTAVKAGDEAEANAALKHIVRAAMQEPTLAEVEAAGVTLTDEQYMEIYAWVLGGLEGLDRFRRASRNGADQHDEADAGAAERPDGNHGQLGGVVRGRGGAAAGDGAGTRPAADASEDQG